MTGTLRSEWTKLRSLPSTAWLLLAAIVLTVAVSTVATGTVDTSHCPPDGCHENTLKLALTGIRLGQFALVVLAVITVSAEYGTGTILPTLTTTPHRLRLLAAKSIMVTVIVAAAGTLSVLICVAIGRAVLPGKGFDRAHGYPPLSLLDGPTFRTAGSMVLYLVLVALLSVGLATLVRDTATALTGVFATLFVSPILLQLVRDPDWQRRLTRWTPEVGALKAPALYAALALALGAVALTRRDA
jgi:ABC-2 type transport system permease protein